MKKNILIFMMGVIITSGIVYATDMLIPAASISFESEHTDKTNVADALNEIFENQKGSLNCPNGYDCEYQANEYKITYEPNGGTLANLTYNSIYDDTYWLEAPTKSGYAFGGWFLDESLTKYVSSTTKVKTASNHTLYAKWGSPVTVTFNANGGKVNPETKEVALEGRYGVLPRAYKEGYILEGWYSDSELTNKVNESTTVTNENNHILYAKWVLGNTPLYDVVLSKLDTSKKSQAMSYGAAPTENGVFEYDGPTSSDKGELPIYFYRGNITDNNVLFAGYCWKIIRTTQTGGTKLIYAGKPTGTAPNYVCNNTGTNAQVSTNKFNSSYTVYYNSYYTYSNIVHGVGTDSVIKSYIEGEKTGDWFGSSNFAGKNNSNYALLEDHAFCIDRRYGTSRSSSSWSDSNSTSSVMRYAGAIRRDSTKKPYLDCYHVSKDNTDRLTVKGGQLSKKIALISSDEVMLAGGGNFANSSYYLATNSNWWTLSPLEWYGPSNIAITFMVYPNGQLHYKDGSYTADSYGVRPVVSLSINAKVSEGNGSSSSPYKVES